MPAAIAKKRRDDGEHVTWNRQLERDPTQDSEERARATPGARTRARESRRVGVGIDATVRHVGVGRVCVGRGVILNTTASVDHDSVVGDFAHVSAGATVGARCHIGAEALIAIGATVVSMMTVGARTVIGSGAVVVAPIPAGVVAFGVPARIRPDRKP